MPPDKGQPLVAVLAAGLASRFGGGKLDAMCAGKPLGKWVLDAVEAAGMPPGVIVVGPDAPQFVTGAGDWRLAVNDSPGEGLGQSVAIAAQKALRLRRSLLILLADMPLVTADHMQHLASSGGTAATRYPDGRVGVPAFIPASEVGVLTRLEGTGGAAALLGANADLHVVEADPRILLDVDRSADLAAVEAMLKAR